MPGKKSTGPVLNPPCYNNILIQGALLTAPHWAPRTPPSPSMCLIPLHIISYHQHVRRDFYTRKKTNNLTTADVNINAKDTGGNLSSDWLLQKSAYHQGRTKDLQQRSPRPINNQTPREISLRLPVDLDKIFPVLLIFGSYYTSSYPKSILQHALL